MGRVKELTEELCKLELIRGVIDGVYEELMEVMKQGLVEVSGRKVRRGQLRFTREIAKLRKEFHRAERDWLECDDQGRRKQKRRECVGGCIRRQ